MTTERRRGFSLAEQTAVLVPLLVGWGLSSIVLLGVVLTDPDRRAELLLDPNHTGGLPWYTGLLSQIGAIGWCVAATSAAFAAGAARLGGRPHAARFLRGGALLLTLLLLDDLFQLHSAVLLDATGAPKVAIVGAYGVLAIMWAVANAAEIRRTRWQILFMGGGAMVASALVDAVVDPKRTDLGLWLEDSAKFLGIVAVATYFAITGLDVMRSVIGGLAGEGAAGDRTTLAAASTTEPAGPVDEVSTRSGVPARP